MNNLWNYPLLKTEIHHKWHPTPHRKATRIRSLSIQGKLNLLAQRIREEQKRSDIVIE